jgi:hypothetical protein
MILRGSSTATIPIQMPSQRYHSSSWPNRCPLPTRFGSTVQIGAVHPVEQGQAVVGVLRAPSDPRSITDDLDWSSTQPSEVRKHALGLGSWSFACLAAREVGHGTLSYPAPALDPRFVLDVEVRELLDRLLVAVVPGGTCR